MSKPPSAKSILRNEKAQEQKRYPIAKAYGGEMYLPNHSGDHSRGLVRDEPERDNAIVNKKYVDDNDFWERDSVNGEIYPKTITDKIGIGTDSPENKLHVKDSSSDLMLLEGTSLNSYLCFENFATASDGFKVGTNGANSYIYNYETNGKIYFGTEGSAKLTLDEDGRAGIGTTSPGAKLNILESSGGATTRPLMIQNPNSSDNTGVGISFSLNSGNGIFASIDAVRPNLPTGGDTDLIFNTYNSGFSEKMRIKSSGFVGIGTTSPTAKLHVVGDSKFTDDIMLSATKKFYLDGGGDTYIYSNAQDTISFVTGDGVPLVIANTGLVRIGDGGTTNYAEFKADGELNLKGTAQVYKSKSFTFNYSQITAQGKPTLVNRGVFFGWSLPIYAADNEELFTCSCVPLDWDETSDPTFSVTGWLDTANTAKKFNLEISAEIYDPTANEVIPTTSNDYEIETTTETWAQYTSFTATVTFDASAINLRTGKPLGIRVRRLEASTAEITGEVVIEGAVLTYKSNKLGLAS